jgi:hypothetical protein
VQVRGLPDVAEAASPNPVDPGDERIAIVEQALRRCSMSAELMWRMAGRRRGEWRTSVILAERDGRSPDDDPQRACGR